MIEFIIEVENIGQQQSYIDCIDAWREHAEANTEDVDDECEIDEYHYKPIGESEVVELHCLVFVYVAYVLLYEEGLLVVAADRGSATDAVREGDYERAVSCFLEAD